MRVMIFASAVLVCLSTALPANASNGCLHDEAAGKLVVADVRNAKGGYAEQALIEREWRFDMQVVVAGRRFERFGLPRLLGVDEVELHAFVDGVPFFAEAGHGAAEPSILYGLYNPLMCEFQPFVAVQ